MKWVEQRLPKHQKSTFWGARILGTRAGRRPREARPQRARCPLQSQRVERRLGGHLVPNVLQKLPEPPRCLPCAGGVPPRAFPFPNVKGQAQRRRQGDATRLSRKPRRRRRRPYRSLSRRTSGAAVRGRRRAAIPRFPGPVSWRRKRLEH